MADMIKAVVSEVLGKSGTKHKTSVKGVVGKKDKAVPKITGARRPAQPPPKFVIIRQYKKESEEAKKTLKELVRNRK